MFTHARDDLRQDGGLACELTWNAFRDHVVLECEVARIDGDLGCSNAGFPPVASGAEEKFARLHHHFATRVGKHRSDAGTSRGPTRLRAWRGGHEAWRRTPPSGTPRRSPAASRRSPRDGRCGAPRGRGTCAAGRRRARSRGGRARGALVPAAAQPHRPGGPGDVLRVGGGRAARRHRGSERNRGLRLDRAARVERRRRLDRRRRRPPPRRPARSSAARARLQPGRRRPDRRRRAAGPSLVDPRPARADPGANVVLGAAVGLLPRRPRTAGDPGRCRIRRPDRRDPRSRRQPHLRRSDDPGARARTSCCSPPTPATRGSRTTACRGSSSLRCS